MNKILVNLLKIGISVALVGWLVWDAMNRGESAFTEDGRFAPAKLVEVVRHGVDCWWLLLAAWVACASAVVLTLVRWYYLVRALELPFRLKDALRLGFLGYLFNLAPFGIVGGDLLKAWLLTREQHGRRAEAVATVLVDRAVGLYMLFVVASAAILLTGFWTTPAAFVQWTCKLTLLLTVIGTVAMGLVVLPDISRGKTTRWLRRVPKIGPPLLRLVDAVQMYRQKRVALAASAVMSVGVHALFTAGILLIAMGLYDRVPGLGVHFVLSPVSAATGVVPIALGPFEFMLDRLYIYAPMAGSGTMALGQGLVVAFGYRIITVLIAAVGACYYLGSRQQVAEVLHDAHREGQQQPNRTPVAETVA